MHKKSFCCVSSHLQIYVSTFLIIGCMGNYYASLPAIGDSLAIATRDSRNNQSRRPVDGGCDTRHFLFRDSSQAEQVFCSYLNGKWWSAAWRVSVPAVLHLIAFGFIWRKMHLLLILAWLATSRVDAKCCPDRLAVSLLFIYNWLHSEVLYIAKVAKFKLP